MTHVTNMSDVAQDALRVVPLGGLGEIGRNMMVYETADDMVIVDAGLLFPSDDMHGVDYIIPDATYVLERRDKLRGYLITHGHEDHIGALRFLIPQLQAPIYAAPLALGLIGWRLEESGILDAEMIEAGNGSVFDFGSITAEFFPVAHSIPDAFGIALRTPAGLVVHTGDFKIDHTPVMSEPTDLQRLAAYGQEGVRLLCSDSTYADKSGVTPSETVVGDALEQILLTAPGRVIIATFASQIARIQQIIDAADESGRVVFATGRSMEKNIDMSRDLGYVRTDDRRLRPITDLGSAHDENTVIICTGAQGEPMAALSRMATGSHRDVNLKPGDTVVLSSSPIPGNESAVNNTINNLYRRGVEVFSVGSGHEHVHVRGHAAQEELKTVLSLTEPQAFVPDPRRVPPPGAALEAGRVDGDRRRRTTHPARRRRTGAHRRTVRRGRSGRGRIRLCRWHECRRRRPVDHSRSPKVGRRRIPPGRGAGRRGERRVVRGD